MEAEIKRLREQVAELEGTTATQERPRVRQRISGAAGGGFIPVMPGLIPAELYQWIEGQIFRRHSSMGTRHECSSLTSKMAEGAEWDSGAQFSIASRASGLISSDTSGLRGAVPMVDGGGETCIGCGVVESEPH